MYFWVSELDTAVSYYNVEIRYMYLRLFINSCRQYCSRRWCAAQKIPICYQSTYAPKKIPQLSIFHEYCVFIHSELKIEKSYNKNVCKARDCRNGKIRWLIRYFFTPHLQVHLFVAHRIGRYMRQDKEKLKKKKIGIPAFLTFAHCYTAK